MYNEIQIRKLRIAAGHYDLEAPDKFWNSEYTVLSSVCNGCGPECMRKDSRESLTEIISRYAPAFAIHDVDYEIHNMTRTQADKRMRKNMIKIWRKDFGFWRWLSFAGIFNRVVVIPTVYAAVRHYGNSAWKATKRRL